MDDLYEDFTTQLKQEIEHKNALSKDFLRSSIQEVMQQTKKVPTA